MAGLTLSEIREALAAQLRANLDAETNVSVRGELKPAPVITIRNVSGDYDRALGHQLSDLVIELDIDPGNDDESSVLRVDDYLSSGTGNNSSIIDAIDVDATLGGAVDDCDVTSYRRDTDSSATLVLTIMARRV